MSNLLERASVVLTPTAYNNGEALCIKPDDASGDFQFSRNSAATRVNAQGLVENVQILSSNLVQNGDFSEEGSEEVSNGSFSQEGAQLVTNGSFDTDSDWNIGTNWSVENGKATSSGSNFSASVYQSISSQTNKIYRVEIEVSDYVSGTLRVVNRGNFVELPQSNGVHIVYLNTSSSSDNFLYLEARPFIGSIDNVSVREVGQDWTLNTGWSIGENKAICNGTTANLIQSNVGTANKNFKLVFTISDYISGVVRPAFVGFYDESTDFSGNGTYTTYISSLTDLRFVFYSTSFNGSITNISVKEVGQNWVLGSFTSIGNNVANIVNSTGELSLQQDIGVSQKTIKLTYTISNYSSGGIRPQYGAVNGLNRSANGTYTEIITGANVSSNLSFFSVTANTTATITNISVIQISTDTNLPRINYEGFSYQDALGSEQVVNGGFENGSANWTVAGGNPIFENSSVNLVNFSTINSNNTVVEQGKTYKITYTISNKVGSSSFGFFLGGWNVAQYQDVGTHSEIISVSSSSVIYIRNGNSNSSVTIDNVSVKEYLGQEVVPDSGCGSWLWESQSTNLLPYSSDYTQWNKSGSMVITSNNAISPDGTQNASLLTANAANQYIYLSAFAAANSTISLYIKRKTGTGDIELSNNGGSSYTVLSVTDEWNRVQVTFAASTNQTVIKINTSGDEIYLWGVQLEALSYASSLIPTSGSQVTRNQDVCNNGGSLASINSTEGTLYFEGSAFFGANEDRQISISDGGTSNRVAMALLSNGTQIQFVVSSGGSITVNTTQTIATITSGTKIAFAYKANDFKIYANGLLIASDTSGAVPTGLNTLGLDRGDGGDNFYGKTKALAVWKEALSDQELAELTTI